MKTNLSWVFCATLILSTTLGGAFSFMPVTTETPPATYNSTTAIPTVTSASIRIVSPLDNQIVPIGQSRVEIEAENIVLDGGHPWRLYLDGNLIATIENGETTYTLPIGVSGPHVITATLMDVQKRDLASASVQVTAAPETPSSSPFNLPWVAPTMAVMLIGVAALVVISLRITRGEVKRE